MRRIEGALVRDLAVAAGLGAVAGLRSMIAPNAIALAMNQDRLRVPRGRFEFLESTKAVVIIGSLAIGELIVDKLPGAPSRTAPPALATRILAGGLAGAALSASKRRSVVAGAAIGGVGAVAGSFLGYYTRKLAAEKLHVKDTSVAAVEDAIAVGAGFLLAA